MTQTPRRFLGGLSLLALASVGCEKAKPASDSTASILRAPDTLKPAPVSVPDSVALAKKADTRGAATKVVNVTTGKAESTKTKPGIVGHDSAPANPKLIGLPVVSDTAKRRKPL